MTVRQLIKASFLLVFGLFLMNTVFAAPLNLGVAGQFNTFVLGDMIASNSDVQGRLAVGGNLSLDHYGIGQSLNRSSANTDTLIVGGTLTMHNTRIYEGNVSSGGTAVLDDTVGFYSGSDPLQTNGTYRTGNPLDFSAIGDALKNQSNIWSTWSTAGSTVFEDAWGNIILTNHGSGVDVFDLTASQLASASSLWVNIPDSAYALINVDGLGDPLSLANFAFFETDANGNRVQVPDGGQGWSFAQRILINVNNAASLDIHGIAIEGSLFAPSVNTHFYNAQVDGNFVVGSLSAPRSGYNTGQVNFDPMTVPEPPTVWLLGLSVFFWITWNQRIRKR